jgi:beta-glucanase (GH16 family)
MKYTTLGILSIAMTTSSILFSNSSLAEPKLVWSDEFNIPGLPDSSKWSYDSGILGFNEELQYYSESRSKNARVEDGVLIIEAHKETSPETPFGNTADYTSARLVTKTKGDWQYGRFEIRAKLPYGNGTWPAIWMLPTGNKYGGWPHSGEIDIMEHVGSHMNEVLGTLHYSNRFAGEGPTKSIMLENVDTEFHVYAIEWRPDEIRWFVDDTLYHTRKNPQTGWQDWPFDQPFHIILNIAVGGTLGGRKGVDPDIWPQRMVVDYVRVYDLGDSPKLDNDGDKLVDAVDSDDDNDGFSDSAEMDAGSNPHNSDSTPETQLALLRNVDLSDGLTPWYKRTQSWSSEGEVIGDVFQPLAEEDVSRNPDGSITFKLPSSGSGQVDTHLFQSTDVKRGLKPGDMITFEGKAIAELEEGAEAEAFIIAYTAMGGIHDSSVSIPINSETGAFSLKTTLTKGPVQGIALGFSTKVPGNKSGKITFSDLTFSLTKSHH